MALHMVRTTQTAEFVHVSDTDAIRPVEGAAWPGPSAGWLSAVGQPASCTRFRVRPLSALELSEATALLPPADADERVRSVAAAQWAQRLCDLGIVAMVDGATETPGPITPSNEWAYTLASLVQDVTLYGPFGARPSR